MLTNFIPRHEAERITAVTNSGFIMPNLPKAGTVGLLSFVNHDAEPLELDGYWAKVLQLRFADKDPKNCSDKWVEEHQHELFNDEQADKVLEFLIEAEQAGLKEVWCHCEGGISRSAGAAKFIAELYSTPFNHDYNLYNRHVYSTLRSAMMRRMVEGKKLPYAKSFR